MELRDYQIELSEKGANILKQYGIVYYCMQVRTGKTLTALSTVDICGYKKVLFLTKLKAIKSIEKDYSDMGYTYQLTVSNNESLHKITDIDFDCVVMDEGHRFGSYPKPSKGTKDFKARFSKLPLILLSGTPHPESYSQIFHQFWISNRSPFISYGNFYKWFASMGCVKAEFEMAFGTVANYSNNKASIDKFYDFKHRFISKYDPEKEQKKLLIETERQSDLNRMDLANAKIMGIIEPYMVRYTQKEAGFTSTVNETILYCNMKPETISMAKKLKDKRVLQGKSEVILGDTPVKLMTKCHQIYSGTVKFESGNTMILDDSKGQFIKERFNGKKLAIFYKFQEELTLLKAVFNDKLVTTLNEFNGTDKHIALQIVSGREGISLKEADCLVYYNIDFSALSYFQSRDRLTTMDRLTNDVYWIFTKGGIEKKIHDAVVKKKNYTASAFMKLK